MRFWRNTLREGLAVVAACLLLGGCHAAADARPRLALDQARIDRGGTPVLRARIEFQPSSVQLDALDHGVPLVLALRIAGDANLPPMHARVTMRYFPLSERYQLRVEPGAHDASFALRGYLFDALERLRVPLPRDPCPHHRGCRLRVGFDYAALPGALRLPALLQSAWRVTPVRVALAAP